jgi:hypothetical protein
MKTLYTFVIYMALTMSAVYLVTTKVLGDYALFLY